MPAPLDHVEPSPVSPNYYVLGDGTLASVDEIERIYAEQQRRARGQDEFEPASQARAADRHKDGAYIPRANQLAKDFFEKTVGPSPPISLYHTPAQ